MSSADGMLARAMNWLGVDLKGSEATGYTPHGATQAIHDDREDGVYPLHPERHETATCPIVRAEPTTMAEATPVADEIKRQIPVVLNLENASPEEARRIKDFLGGVTYGLNGYMRKIANWVYVCAPFDMPVERLILDSSREGTARYAPDGPTAPTPH
jgi:FtsZ-interacting cell division protein YlmF